MKLPPVFFVIHENRPRGGNHTPLSYTIVFLMIYNLMVLIIETSFNPTEICYVEKKKRPKFREEGTSKPPF